MVVIIFLTMFLIFIPALYMVNEKYVQQLALLFSVSHIALLAICGRLDFQLSSFISTSVNHVFENSIGHIFHQILSYF